MAAESSFDVVSKVDRQEVDNALNQAAKEVRQRFDFKNTDASIRWSGEAVEMEANSEERVKAVLDVFQSKLIKRGVSLKSLDAGEPRPSGKLYKITATTDVTFVPVRTGACAIPAKREMKSITSLIAMYPSGSGPS